MLYHEIHRVTFGEGRYTTLKDKIREITKSMINNYLNGIGKQNNQTSVSDADSEIPIIGSTDNAGNSVNLVPALSVYPRAGISRSAFSWVDKRHYFMHVGIKGY